MFVDTITISKEAIKKYGTTGAIVLQVLYSEFGMEIPEDHDKMKELFHGYMDMSLVKGTLTKLYNAGKIGILDGTIYLAGMPKTPQLSIYDFTDEEKPEEKVVEETKKEPNETWKMAETLCDVLGFSENFKDPKRYLRPAKKLLENYTIEFIQKRYGKGGDWYKHEYKGQQGSPPNLNDIYKTIDKTYNTFAEAGKQEVKTMWS